MITDAFRLTTRMQSMLDLTDALAPPMSTSSAMSVCTSCSGSADPYKIDDNDDNDDDHDSKQRFSSPPPTTTTSWTRRRPRWQQSQAHHTRLCHPAPNAISTLWTATFFWLLVTTKPAGARWSSSDMEQPALPMVRSAVDEASELDAAAIMKLRSSSLVPQGTAPHQNGRGGALLVKPMPSESLAAAAAANSIPSRPQQQQITATKRDTNTVVSSSNDDRPPRLESSTWSRQPRDFRKVWWVNTWADHVWDQDVLSNIRSPELDDGIGSSSTLTTATAARTTAEEEDDMDIDVETSLFAQQQLKDEAMHFASDHASWNDENLTTATTTQVNDEDDSPMGWEEALQGPPSVTWPGEPSAMSQNENTPDGYDVPAILSENDKSPYISSGHWRSIDGVLTFGLARNHPSLRPSRYLRYVRKSVARTTGWHGVMSGKQRQQQQEQKTETVSGEDESPMPTTDRISTFASLEADTKTMNTTSTTQPAQPWYSSLYYQDQQWDRATDRHRRDAGGDQLDDDGGGQVHGDNDRRMGLIRRRLARIEEAKRNVDAAEAAASMRRRGFFFGWFHNEAQVGDLYDGEQQQPQQPYDVFETEINFSTENQELQIEMDENQRMDRLREIDRLFIEGQQRLMQLACEKDVLQRRPSPLWNYTAKVKRILLPTNNNTSSSIIADHVEGSHEEIEATRDFIFPTDDLVEEYLGMLISNGRLVKMNHTYLWRKELMDDDDLYDDDDDFLSPLEADKVAASKRRRRNGYGNANNNNGNGGSWFLRNGLGEKLGAAVEEVAYKSICHAVMGILAKAISALHGVNVMTYSDIRLSLEQAPDLPPILPPGFIPAFGKHQYTQDAVHGAIRRGARMQGRRQRFPNRRPPGSSFIQLDAVVETMISHCQIAAPLLKTFPLAWQRAMLANIITLVTSVVSDFFDGLEFQILGHRLSFAFTPITEEDMMRGFVHDVFNRQVPNPAEFEAAVLATAEELSRNLNFLDRWHQRALGSGVLQMQVATLIARLVLTLIDDVLRGARMDLWGAHAGGPRLVAGLEFRSSSSSSDAQPSLVT